jgi:signal transduction histidine kinase
VTVTTETTPQTVMLAISDDGPGIPADQLQEALRRGGRLDERGSGAGLGLAIVTDIIESWGGTLKLENARPGLTARVTLARPAAQERAPNLTKR